MRPFEDTRLQPSLSVELLGEASREWQQARAERAPYEQLLRAAGRYFDQQQARQITLIEGPSSFHLRHATEGAEPSWSAVEKRFDELVPPFVGSPHAPRRRLLSLRFGRAKVAPPDEREPGRVGDYEDTLRALGHELDDGKCYNLLMDEVDDGFLVTYQYLNPAEGFAMRKAMYFLDPAAIDRMRQTARERRGTGGREPVDPNVIR
ncbi:MAG TPA: hypothetical protein VKX16_05585 [Chloroflexota bacterium]|nr:hypothetical protein [Chloroflexota bacterium]